MIMNFSSSAGVYNFFFLESVFTMNKYFSCLLISALGLGVTAHSMFSVDAICRCSCLHLMHLLGCGYISISSSGVPASQSLASENHCALV